MKTFTFESNKEFELVLEVLRVAHHADSEAANFYDAVIVSGAAVMFDSDEHKEARESADMLADVIERLTK